MLACSLAVALTVAALPAPPERIVLAPATGTNVAEGLLAAAQDVLKGHLERTGHFQVTLAPGAPGLRPEPSAAEVAGAAREAGVGRGLALRVTRLGASAKVRLSCYDAQGVLQGVDELTAGSPDDLDAVLSRLARALADGRPAAQLAEIDTVTEREADAYLKFTATHVFGVKIGELVALSRPVDGASGIPGIGAFWLYDARDVLAEVTIDYYGHEGQHAFAIGLGAYYPFLRGNVTPYTGGALRYAWTTFGGAGSSGIQTGAALGMLYGRLSTVQFRAELGYFANLFREQRSTFFDPQSGTFVSTSGGSVLSHGPTFSVGIGF